MRFTNLHYFFQLAAQCLDCKTVTHVAIDSVQIAMNAVDHMLDHFAEDVVQSGNCDVAVTVTSVDGVPLPSREAFVQVLT